VKKLFKKPIILLIAGIFIISRNFGQLPVPTKAQLKWQNAELAVLISYDLHVFDSSHYIQSANRITPIKDYNIFNPEHLNTDQWIMAAKAAGAKYAILTVTHETGFALYQSDVNPYCLKAIKWKNGKGDIVADFVKSCRKYQIEPGIYIGIRWNSFLGVYDFKVQGESLFSKNRQQWYNRYCEQMTKELVSRYGKLAFIWFDGGANGPEQGGPDILPIVTKYQPEIIFYHNLHRADLRWGGSESGTVPYPCWSTFNYPSWFLYRGDSIDFKPIKYGYPEGNYYIPAMADAPLRGYNGRHEWFWEPNDETHIFPVNKLVKMYDESVGHNATLILGLTPDPDGLIPQPDIDTLKAFGDKIRERYGYSIAETKINSDKLSISIPDGKSFSAIMIEEAIEQGQRVREFSVQVFQNGQWNEIVNGSSIGNKFIAILKEPVKCKEVRLVITKSVEQPIIKRFSIYKL